MAEKLLFLTGRLAEPRLTEMAAGLLEPGAWAVDNLGIKVAALMTEAIVRNRLPRFDVAGFKPDRVLVPGRARMDLQSLAEHFGVPFERGPDEIADLPQFFGRGGHPPDLSRHNLRIFAEIVEAPALTVEALVARGRLMTARGADVIDIGCQPDVAFPHLEAVVAALKSEGMTVSVDSGDPVELRRAALAGADYVLSLDETTLDCVAGTTTRPVLIPKPHGDLASLLRAIDRATALKLQPIADSILDPINFGLTVSLERYAALRRARPGVEILMGTGNLTELTEADSGGVTALLVGICGELDIGNVLIVQVSPHTRRTIEEHDAARRLMYRAKADKSLPFGFGAGLIGLHDVAPNPQSPAGIAVTAGQIRDANFRIEVSDDGVHVYNRAGHHVSTEPFEIFPHLDVAADGAHAFYLGFELAKAGIALSLGKRYVQDRPLDFGVAAPKASENLARHAPVGATLRSKRETEPDEDA